MKTEGETSIDALEAEQARNRVRERRAGNGTNKILQLGNDSKEGGKDVK